MTRPTISAAEADTAAADRAPRIGDFLDPRRVATDLEVSSRKRLFERMAELVSSHPDAPGLDDVLGTLTRREKLGCTGIGRGIALPHGRIQGLAEPVVAVARLKHAIDYQAPDGEPVWLVVCLLVPVEATETHLKILAALAAHFSAPDFPEQLKRCRCAEQLAAHLGGIEVGR